MLTEHDTHAFATIRASLEDIRSAIQTARSGLREGHAVDLTGMDARIERLCTRTLDLPPPLARATLPDLMDLRGTVEALIETLTCRLAP